MEMLKKSIEYRQMEMLKKKEKKRKITHGNVIFLKY